jgi:recombination protein RecA
MAKKEMDLAAVLATELNKTNKDQKVAFFLDGDDAPTNVEGWISTGCAMLDVAVSNRPYGGLPVGRITEVTGLEQSGKSLLSAHLLAETQKQGGVAVLIDTETAVSRDFLEAIGVDVSKLLYVSADSVEQIFEFTETIIEKVRTTQKDKLVTIVVDSVAAASTKNELAADYNKDGYATDKAIIISKAMRKITNLIGRQKITLVFTNQLRQKMNAMFGDPWTTSGGKALAFHASVRLRLKNMGQIKQKVNGQDKTIGMKVRCQVIKNRMGPPLRAADFEIFFDRGIDNFGSWIGVMKENKLVSQGGAWYTYVDTETGEEIKFQSKDFIDLMEEREDVRDQIYKKICEATILQYKSDSKDIEAHELDTEGAEVVD